MENYNNISDKEIHNLLKQRMLEQDDDALLDAEANFVFGSPAIVKPDAKREEEFLKEFKKTKGRFWKWLFPGTAVLISLVVLFYFYQRSSGRIASETADVNKLTVSADGNMNLLKPENNSDGVVSNSQTDKLQEEQRTSNISDRTFNEAADENDTLITALGYKRLKLYRGQLQEWILKENGDFSSPISIVDTNFLLLRSPAGYGEELEILSNTADDESSFVTEHNTGWYKFAAKEDCKVIFDIIPISQGDDFDFILFQGNGPAIRAKNKDNKITPLRTCFSRNDKTIKSKTGLSLDERAPEYIQSKDGGSYVKYVQAKKGQVFYLMVDEPGEKRHTGRGYAIRFHFKPYGPDELYVGKPIFLNKIYFITNENAFKPGSGSESAIDSIAYFLQFHPKIKIEIQGHVNFRESQKIGGEKTNSQKLSEARAKAVFDRLVEKGIDPARMVPAGYGGTRKKIQNPKTVEESSQNVRVDIVILSLDYEADLKLMGRGNNKK